MGPVLVFLLKCDTLKMITFKSCMGPLEEYVWKHKGSYRFISLSARKLWKDASKQSD